MPVLVLASSSTSRIQLLKQHNIKPDAIAPSEIDEVLNKGEHPKLFTKRISQEKALATAANLSQVELVQNKHTLILAADTMVCVGRRPIRKCKTKEDVRSAMAALSGKNHRVYTSVCLLSIGGQGPSQQEHSTSTEAQARKSNGGSIHEIPYKVSIKTTETRIKFKRLLPDEIEASVNSQEGIGKSGGYTLAGLAEAFAIHIIGSYSGVIGLPMYETINLLRSNGYKL